MKKLSTIAEVRHVDRPFGIGIIILDRSDALIHYVEPDSADLTTTAADVALHTTDPPVDKNFLHMFDSIWQNAVPIERKMRELRPASVVSV